MDNCTEQLVVKRRSNSDNAKAMGIIAGMALIAAVSLFFTFQGYFILLMVAAGALFGGFWLLKGMGIE